MSFFFIILTYKYNILSVENYFVACDLFFILLFNTIFYVIYHSILAMVLIFINNERYYASRQMEKFERDLNYERLSKKEVSLGGKKQQLYYHEDLLVSYCCNRYTILPKSSC
jgi:hypothetical protein